VAEVVEKRLAVGECGRPVDAFARVDIIGEFARHFAELAEMPDGTPEEVQRKANRYRTLREDEMECRWLRRACDFWTAGFFADKRHEAHVAPTTADVWKALAGKYEQGRLVLTLDSAYEYTDADLDLLGCRGAWIDIQKILSRILRSCALLRIRSGLEADQARYFRETVVSLLYQKGTPLPTTSLAAFRKHLVILLQPRNKREHLFRQPASPAFRKHLVILLQPRNGSIDKF
jgi:hypothetical protein